MIDERFELCRMNGSALTTKMGLQDITSPRPVHNSRLQTCAAKTTYIPSTNHTHPHKTSRQPEPNGGGGGGPRGSRMKQWPYFRVDCLYYFSHIILVVSTTPTYTFAYWQHQASTSIATMAQQRPEHNVLYYTHQHTANLTFVSYQCTTRHDTTRHIIASYHTWPFPCVIWYDIIMS